MLSPYPYFANPAAWSFLTTMTVFAGFPSSDQFLVKLGSHILEIYALRNILGLFLT